MTQSASSRDIDWMRAALAYGRRHLGETGSNPAVGALVVKDDVVIGRGATQSGGRPHAETEALRQAGAAAAGATLYVTLEPCSHHGKTPPCAEAVLAAKIGRVVSAIEDPDSRVAGRGHALLRAAGVETLVGVCADQAARDHRGHFMRVRAGRPMLALKLAETRDGFAAGDSHDPRLHITGPATDGQVHILRSIHDAILVGAGTARIDDPLLTVRLPGLESRRPLRVVFDSGARLSLGSRLAASARERSTLIVVGPQASVERIEALRGAGLRVETAPAAASGGLDLEAALRLLGDLGLQRIFCEGGPTLASALLAAGLVDEALMVRADKPLGRPGLPALSAQGREELARADRWRLYDARQTGADRWSCFERIG